MKNEDPISFHDPADLPRASMECHPADQCLEAWCDRCGRAVDAVCPGCKGNVSAAGAIGTATTVDGVTKSSLTPAEFYRRLVNLLQSSRNTRFTLVCYLIATGDAYADGVTLDEAGKQWGVTRACVSKHCVFICEYLALEPSRYMMDAEHREKFRKSNRRPQKH